MSSSNASRILFVKNLNHKTTGNDLYELFTRYGSVRQIRLGNGPKTRGTAYVVYAELSDAKSAYESLSGFHLADRYIVLLYYSLVKQQEKDLAKREEELERLKSKHNIPEATT